MEGLTGSTGFAEQMLNADPRWSVSPNRNWFWQSAMRKGCGGQAVLMPEDVVSNVEAGDDRTHCEVDEVKLE